MPQVKPTPVYARNGLKGFLEADQVGNPALSERVFVRFEDGRRVSVPVELLAERQDGGYDLPVSREDLQKLGNTNSNCGTEAEGSGLVVVPVVAEVLSVGKRRIETGGIRVRKRVVEHEELVDEPLWREQVEVERVSIDRVIETTPEIRQEGDTTIIPVVEEVVVVEKRLMLREELRVTRRRTEERRPQQVRVRAEEATVERLSAGEAGVKPASSGVNGPDSD